MLVGVYQFRSPGKNIRRLWIGNPQGQMNPSAVAAGPIVVLRPTIVYSVMSWIRGYYGLSVPVRRRAVASDKGKLRGKDPKLEQTCAGIAGGAATFAAGAGIEAQSSQSERKREEVVRWAGLVAAVANVGNCLRRGYRKPLRQSRHERFVLYVVLV